MNELNENSIIIIGGEGFALEVSSFLLEKRTTKPFNLLGYVSEKESTTMDIDYLGNEDKLTSLFSEGAHNLVLCIEDMEKRSRFFEKHKDKGFNFPPIIHQTAVISKSTHLGPGSVVYPQVTLSPKVSLDCLCWINSNASIGHESKIGNFVNIGPGANIAGNVFIDEETYIGMGASVREKITIGKKIIVGAGAAVVTNLEVHGTYVGAPASNL